MLSAAHRLRRRVDFADTVRRGRRAARRTLVVHALVPPTDRPTDPVRAGFVVSRAVGGSVVRHQVARRLRHLMAQLDGLLSTEAPAREQGTSAVEALHDIARRTHRRSLVVLFSDMMDNNARREELFDAMQHLRYNKHDVILFHVTDRRKELELELEDRPYTFVDLETGEQVKAHAAEIRDEYRTAVADHWHQLKLKCGQYRIDLVEADINKGFSPILLEFLLKRSRLY